MGRANAWISVRGLDRSEVVERLGCRETSRPAEWGRADLSLGDMGNGWLVVRCLAFDHPTRELLEAMSVDAEVLSCQINEYVMVSIARGYRDGRQIWSAVHEPEKGIFSLIVDGSPPPELAEIERRLRAEQEAEGGEEAEVDLMFDAPSEIVAALSGYRDDQDQGTAFVELLQPQPPKTPGLLQRLFGRR